MFCDMMRQETEERHARHRRIGRFRRPRAVRAEVSLRDLAAAQASSLAVRGGDARRVRQPGADAQGHAAAHERDAAVAALQLDRPQRAAAGEPGAGDFYHWHVEVMPKLTRVAGFEWGTGFYINPTGPEEAAEVLRKTKL